MNTALHRIPRFVVFFGGFLFLFAGDALSQAPTEKPKEKLDGDSQEKTAEPPNAAQIELLETKYRFETNGDSRKEVHALVKINCELGVRQFARLNFDYNRSFQSVEIPLVHIKHTNGGTSDILPSAITDAPNPAVEKFPAYHDVRVKSVRILGLQPGDSLEYRVITTTTKPPLAPDFWLSHWFDRTGVVETEDFTLDLPTSVQIRVNPETPAESVEKSNDSSRATFHWRLERKPGSRSSETDEAKADIALSTLDDYGKLADKLARLLYPRDDAPTPIRAKAEELFATEKEPKGRIKGIYDLVSKKIVTVDLPIGVTGFQTRKPEEILASGYATQEDKARLFAALARAVTVDPYLYLTFASGDATPAALPARFDHLLVGAYLESGKIMALDPALQVAPFTMIPPKLRGKPVFCVTQMNVPGAVVVSLLPTLPNELPFSPVQQVKTISSLNSAGTLSTKVQYRLRGDNELLLRVTFHQTPLEKQMEIGQYLALSDGFRGKVTSVKTSDPYDTDKPFEVEYELTQEKFVDWSKKLVLIPALLPLPGLPEAPKKQTGDAKIELGPPLNIELTGTLRLPAGTTARAPAGTSAKRDYATFSSEYSAKENVLHFSRELNFLASELPAARSADLGAFLHAVQIDQSQLFALNKPDSVPPAGKK